MTRPGKDGRTGKVGKQEGIRGRMVGWYHMVLRVQRLLELTYLSCGPDSRPLRETRKTREAHETRT